MYKQLPNEDEAQRKSRMAKDMRAMGVAQPDIEPVVYKDIPIMEEKPAVQVFIKKEEVIKKKEIKKPLKFFKKGRR